MTHRRTSLQAFLRQSVAIVVAAVVLSSTSAVRAADLSDPKAAAHAFAEAMVANDSAALHAAAVGTDEQWQMITSLGNLLAGQKKLAEAATAKFGDEAKMPQNNPLKDLDEKLKDAEVAITGDDATITFKNATASSQPMKLKKEGGDWKVDLTSMNMGHNANMTPDKLQKMSELLTETAGEISAGKYATMREAQQAMAMKMAAAMRPASAPAK